MMQKHIYNLMKKYIRILFAYIMYLYANLCFASGLPSINNQDFSKGDYVDGIKNLVFQGLKVVFVVIAAAAFVGYSWALIHKFIEAKREKSWGEFSIVLIIGAIVVVMILIFANIGNDTVS